MGRDRPWLHLLVAFIAFWVLFGVNVFLVGLFADTSVAIIAALATIGELLVAVTIPLTEMMSALVVWAGITRKTSN